MSLRGLLDYPSSSEDEQETDEDNKKKQDIIENNIKSKREYSSQIEKDLSYNHTISPKFGHSSSLLESSQEENETSEEKYTANVNQEPSNSIENYVELVSDNLEYNCSHEDENVSKLDVPQLPGMSKRELKGLKSAVWKDIISEGITTHKKPVAIEQSANVAGTTEVSSEDQSSRGLEQYYEYYQYHYNQYQLYLETCNKEGGYSEEVSKQYSQWLSDLYNRIYYNSSNNFFMNQTNPAFKQRSFEELQAQDRELERYFDSGQNTFSTMRAAHKSTFRGTRTYQENNKGYNPSHFNNLTPGAKRIRAMFKEKIQDSSNIERPPKSNKQKKREAWRETMKSRIKK